jgi:hypothetical protein
VGASATTKERQQKKKTKKRKKRKKLKMGRQLGQTACGADELFAALRDPAVISVHLELGVSSLVEVHAELVRMWLFFVAQLHGSTTLSSEMLTAASCAEVCAMFTKLGVVCHVDGTPPAPPTDPLAAFHSTCVAPSGTHTIAFSLSHKHDPRSCRTLAT